MITAPSGLITLSCWGLLALITTQANAAATLHSQSRSEQDSHRPIDYANAKPRTLPLKSGPSKTPGSASTKGLPGQLTHFRDAPVVVPGQRGSGHKEHQQLLPDTERLLALDSRDVDTTAPIGTLEYTDWNGNPFTASRVDLLGQTNSDTYPYRAVGKLFGNTDEGSFECSGALIAPGIVVTAAHCVTEFGSNQYDQDFEFVPAYRYGEAPYGVWKYTEVIATAEFLQGTDTCAHEDVNCQNDIALLRLESREAANGNTYALGAKTGWLPYGLNHYGFDQWDQAQIKELGYPGTYDRGMTMQSTDTQCYLAENTGMYLTGSRMTSGSSGGPWIINFGEDAVLSGDSRKAHGSQRNTVVGITVAGHHSEEAELTWAAPFTSENLGALMDTMCPEGSKALSCIEPAPGSGDGSFFRGITMALEEPVENSNYSGIGNLRGWAVSPFGIDHVDIYIDGKFRFEAPYGGSRPDVAENFPDYPDSEASGFSLAYGYTNLSRGKHSVRAVAYDYNGDFFEVSSDFTVSKFHKSFVGASDIVDPSTSDVTTDPEGISVRNVIIDGNHYELRLEWRTATQGFEIVDIIKVVP